MSAIAIDTIAHRYGWAWGMSTSARLGFDPAFQGPTVLEAQDRRTSDKGGPDVGEFIILTEFSRCQGGMIGRVSRRPEHSHLQDKDFA
jgi:hypothetical protein